MRAWASVLALAALLAVAGCVTERAPSDRFYTLDIADPGRRYGQPLLDGTVEVVRLSAAGPAGERAIVYGTDDGPALRQYSYHYWIEPPPLQLRNALITALRQSGAARRVVTPETRANAAYRVTGRLIELRHHRAGTNSAVLIEAEIAVVDTRSRETLHVATYDARAPAQGETVSAAVTAAQEALTALTGRFLDDLAGVRKAT